MKTIRQFLLALGWLPLLVALPGRGAPAPLPINTIQAIVQDAVITRVDVEYLIEPLRSAIVASYREQRERQQKILQAYQDGLETLIERKLIMQEFKAAGYNLPETAIDDEIRDRIRKRYGDRVQLVQTLKASGRTYESFRQEVREQIIEEALRAKNVSTEIIISPHRIEAFYATNQTRFAQEDQVKLQMIRLLRSADGGDSAKKRALEIQSKLAAGSPFAEMTIYNEGSQSDWGWITEDKLSKGLTDQFFKLKAGQHTGVIGRGNESEKLYWVFLYQPDGTLLKARQYGQNTDLKEVLLAEHQPGSPALAQAPEPQEFYLLFVEDARGSHVRPLAEVRQEIERNLIVQERARLQKKWISKLRGKTFVQILQVY